MLDLTAPTGLRLALRANFLWLAGGSALTVVLAASLSAQFSGRQPEVVALDIGLSVIRLLLPLFLVLMTQELVSREFDRRYFLNTLSYPHPRRSLLLCRFYTLAALTQLLLVLLCGVLAVLVETIRPGPEPSQASAWGVYYVITVAFIGLELLLLCAVATLLAIAASTPSFVLVGTFGFLLVARSFSSIVELLARNATVVSDPESYRSGIGLLGYLLPDLGALDVRMIALYGNLELLPTDWPWLVLSSLIYTVGLLALAVWALNRKRFA